MNVLIAAVGMRWQNNLLFCAAGKRQGSGGAAERCRRGAQHQAGLFLPSLLWELG